MSRVDAYLPFGPDASESLLAYTIGAGDLCQRPGRLVRAARASPGGCADPRGRPAAAGAAGRGGGRRAAAATCPAAARARAHARAPAAPAAGEPDREDPRQADAGRLPLARGGRHLRGHQGREPLAVRLRRVPAGLRRECRATFRLAYRPLALVGAVLLGFFGAGPLPRQRRDQAAPGAAEGAARRPRPAGDLRRGRPEPRHRLEPRRRRDGASRRPSWRTSSR